VAQTLPATVDVHIDRLKFEVDVDRLLASGSLATDRTGGATTENHRFRQGVTGEAVSPVSTSVRTFTYRIEAWDRSSSVKVCLHATDEIVSCRFDGDEVFLWVNPVGPAPGKNGWELSLEQLGVEVPAVEPRTLPRCDGARNNISGSHLGVGVVIEQETATISVNNVGASATQGFGDESSLLAVSESKSSGVELNEL